VERTPKSGGGGKTEKEDGGDGREDWLRRRFAIGSEASRERKGKSLGKGGNRDLLKEKGGTRSGQKSHREAV